jgi:hypothetical protein
LIFGRYGSFHKKNGVGERGRRMKRAAGNPAFAKQKYPRKAEAERPGPAGVLREIGKAALYKLLLRLFSSLPASTRGACWPHFYAVEFFSRPHDSAPLPGFMPAGFAFVFFVRFQSLLQPTRFVQADGREGQPH